MYWYDYISHIFHMNGSFTDNPDISFKSSARHPNGETIFRLHLHLAMSTNKPRTGCRLESLFRRCVGEIIS